MSRPRGLGPFPCYPPTSPPPARAPGILLGVHAGTRTRTQGMQVGNIAVSRAHYMLHMKLRRPSTTTRQNPSGGGSITSGRTHRSLPLAGLSSGREIATIGRYTYRMFITITLLSLVDLVQDVGVATGVAHYRTHWFRSDIVVIAPLLTRDMYKRLDITIVDQPTPPAHV